MRSWRFAARGKASGHAVASAACLRSGAQVGVEFTLPCGNRAAVSTVPAAPCPQAAAELKRRMALFQNSDAALIFIALLFIRPPR